MNKLILALPALVLVTGCTHFKHLTGDEVAQEVSPMIGATPGSLVCEALTLKKGNIADCTPAAGYYNSGNVTVIVEVEDDAGHVVVRQQ